MLHIFLKCYADSQNVTHCRNPWKFTEESLIDFEQDDRDDINATTAELRQTKTRLIFLKIIYIYINIT